MSDISCAADVYAIMRDSVASDDLPKIADEVVKLFLDEGYSLAKIEEALGDFDEIYDSIEDHTEYEDESEYEDEYEDEYESEYNDEE